MSLPARGAWIEIKEKRTCYVKQVSLPARGAWIEIHIQQTFRKQPDVAPREGSVD